MTLRSLELKSKFSDLPTDFYSKQEPSAIKNPFLVAQSKLALELIGLEQIDISIFSGNQITKNADYISSVYAGHQFGSFVPQLGDGRAILIGEINGYEVQLKGAGKTPYSRFGDGRAVLRSCIREFLCSEAMNALGIPTTRALCVIGSDEDVQRETLEKGAVLTRLSPSHIRFGHFEYFHYSGQLNKVKELTDFCIENYFTGASVADFFEQVVSSTAKLIAKWQAVGFCHGVMNTDNMSILGLTIDYGPFGFLDSYNMSHICNHSDHTGRYAFDQQPGIGLWNLHALAEALSSVLPYEQSTLILRQYQPILVLEYASLMRAKFGFEEEKDEDLHIVTEALNLLHQNKLDYTNFFRGLAAGQVPNELKDWHKKYLTRVSGQDANNRAKSMNLVNPKYILRNYLAQNAIEKAESKDFSEVVKLLQMLDNPFENQPENESYTNQPSKQEAQIEVSCSS